MSHFLANNIPVSTIFQPLTGTTYITNGMFEGQDSLGRLFEFFNTSNTTAITNLYKHITPTKMMVGTQDLTDIFVPLYTDLALTFNLGDFEIPVVF